LGSLEVVGGRFWRAVRAVLSVWAARSGFVCLFWFWAGSAWVGSGLVAARDLVIFLAFFGLEVGREE
jgi:hypothetical protein